MFTVARACILGLARDVLCGGTSGHHTNLYGDGTVGPKVMVNQTPERLAGANEGLLVGSNEGSNEGYLASGYRTLFKANLPFAI